MATRAHRPPSRSGPLSARPPAGSVRVGEFYLATDVEGGTLYRAGSSEWSQVAPGVDEAGAAPVVFGDVVAPATTGGAIGGGNSTLDGDDLYLIRSQPVRRSGTLRDLSVYVQNGGGNVVAAVYDIGVTTPGELTRLWSLAPSACPASFGWRVLGDPQIPVEPGDAFFFGFGCSDGGATFSTAGVPATAASLLPSGFLPGDGIPSRMLARISAAVLTEPPATIAAAAIAGNFNAPVLIARVE